MRLVVEPTGRIRALYGEQIDLAAFGRPVIARASTVEPDGEGRWHADLRPLLGPLLGPFGRRSEALAAEVAWLEEHWLLPGPSPPSPDPSSVPTITNRPAPTSARRAFVPGGSGCAPGLGGDRP
jgi:hypothetical protein